MASLDDRTQAEVETAICAGRKIEAIKRHREGLPGTDLVDAKKAVEEMQARLKQQHPENFGPGAPKAGCLGGMLVLAGLAGGLTCPAACVLVWK